MIKIILKLLKAINSEIEPGQISLGMCFGMFPGLTPLLSLHNFVVLLLVLVLRINVAGFLVGAAIFKGIGYVLDPMVHAMGSGLLEAPALKGLWEGMYDSAFWSLTHFNNTVVMGGSVLALVLFVPLFFILRWLIKRYRERVLKWVMKTRLMTVLKASKFVRLIARVAG